MTEKMVQEILKKHDVTNPESFDDKVFLVGEWSRDTQLDMKRCVITGLARFHEQVTGDRFVEDLPTVAELRQGKNFPELLLSVQAFVLITVNDEIFVPLLQRDTNAKFDPGFWTLPAGRLDQSSFTLGALTEFLEEIRLICGGKHILPHHFCIEREEVVRIFRKSWDTVALSHAAPHAAIQDHKLLLVELPELADQRKVQIINNDMRSRADSGLTLLDGLNHTVEMVVPIRLTLPELPIIYDGESFGRKAELVPLTTLLERGWLEEHPTTFALRTLLTQHVELLKQLAG